MPKKGSKKPQNSSDITSINIDRQQALERLLVRSNWIKERKLVAVASQENCILALSIALMDLKETFNCSWNDLASEYLQCCDGSTLYKIVNRSVGIKGSFYKRVSQSINYLQESRNFPVVLFPDWKEN